MKKIALVDDKDYGILQIKNSMPDYFQYNFEYFDTYKKAVNKKFDILFLDYYLDKDGLTGKDVIHELKADIIIGFSSVPDCNQELLKKGADFAVTKIKQDTNADLNDLMNNILDQY
ncbi:hypothetical protein [Candidatus Absconditicoccus praedator]|uniref:hypothetical protein n=1 Tax=Candidatus Absconditicoccus praedator TaxID=2735562 RepID=UPI001E454B1C|nr:hypothetical protein [Candidatus Absconditicoccus praedator]UFX82911.1 hypothetical protein HLG78_02140 [Candidatus Absconditicoccus praedator]